MLNYVITRTTAGSRQSESASHSDLIDQDLIQRLEKNNCMMVLQNVFLTKDTEKAETFLTEKVRKKSTSL